MEYGKMGRCDSDFVERSSEVCQFAEREETCVGDSSCELWRKARIEKNVASSTAGSRNKATRAKICGRCEKRDLGVTGPGN